MTQFFEHPERIDQLQLVIDGWLGTPFVPHAMVRGGGVDCVQLAAAIMIECGVIERFAPPAYTIDGGLHRQRSLVLEWLDGDPRFARISGQASAVRCLPGDILVFASARSAIEHHVGVYRGGASIEFVNSMPKYGVKIRTLRDGTWSRLLRAVYRPSEATA